MCGIVGIFDTHYKSDINRGLLSRMNEVQHHRGPDEGGIHIEPGLGLAHRRLSIIDISGGHQPLSSKDENIVVTYNGEIYNFADLRRELEEYGHEFQTRCDTEVIVYGWKQWGERCIEKFRGMFAFAVWDRQRDTLFLARDRLGIKPLFYSALANGLFLFASELKALRVHPELSAQIDPTAVEDYFGFGYIPDPKTIFTNVYKLSPGYTLTLRRGNANHCQPRQYWDVSFKEDLSLTETDACEQLIDRFRDAVGVRLISEVPLGAFLSGGVDSSGVVAMMAGLQQQPVNTCSISFGDPAFNESRYAEQVAERYGTTHRVEQVDADDYDLVDRLTSLYDEPFADSSALPTYRVCELAKKQVTVVLSGDGGDECLAGYSRYRWFTNEDKIRSLMPGSIRVPLFGLLGRFYPKADWAPKIFRAKSTLESIGRNSLEAYFHSISVLPNGVRCCLFSDAFKRDLQGYEAFEVFGRYAEKAPEDPLSLVQYLDFKTYLPGDILTKVDRASMAHGLEVRVPILDHQLVDWVSNLPPRLKLKDRVGKFAFKKALESYLPKEILYRSKMGFAVPLASWFRGALKERTQKSLLGGTLLDSGYFDYAFVKKILAHHQSGMRDCSATIWSLLMFESFLRQNG